MTSSTPLLDRWSSVSRWKDMTSLYKEIRADLDRVEDRLESWSRSANPLTAEISRYVLRKKGKRLRPALVLLTSRLFSPGSEESVFLASLVELLHTASLIHDDIVDNAGVRRGRKSVHAKWGPNITVLLGDYLYIKSIGLSLQSRHERVIRLLADVSARMIEGELDEYALAGDLRITEGQYRGIVENKTAVLFGACCRIGAILGLASPEEEESVAAYGLNLGLTFQSSTTSSTSSATRPSWASPSSPTSPRAGSPCPSSGSSRRTGGPAGNGSSRSSAARTSRAPKGGSSSTPWRRGTPWITPGPGPRNAPRGPSKRSTPSPSRRPGRPSSGWPYSA